MAPTWCQNYPNGIKNALFLVSFGELFGSRWRRGAHAIRSSRLDRIACRPSLNQPQIRTKTASFSKARVQRTKTQNKTTTNAPRPLFPPIWAPNWAPGGGSSKSLFRGFSSFGPSWDPNASKIPPRSPQNHPGPPFLPNFARLLKRFRAKHMEIKQKRPAFLCQNLWAFRLLFHYIFWFIPFAEYRPRGNRC